MADSPLLQFYRGTGTDHRGRTLADLQAQDLDALEFHHDYIQWLFPLPEPSFANAHAPLLRPGDIAAFRGDAALRERLLDSLRVMLRFYGLRLAETAAAPEIGFAEDFSARARNWLTPYNHNFLRLSRILRALALLGCGPYAQALLQRLEEIFSAHAAVIGNTTLTYWRGAAQA